MSSIENVVMVNEVMVNEVKVVRVKAKSFAQKDKKTLFSIMAFVKYLEEQGILPDDKTLECLEALPLYKTAAEKTAFFQQDMFDTKVVENELYKPMVSDYKKAKKEKKPREKKQKEEKPKKERKPKEKKVTEPEKEQQPVSVQEQEQEQEPEPAPVKVEKSKKERKPKEKKDDDEAEPKRGRKPKQQIVELAQDVVQPEEKDPLDSLIQAMNEKETPVPVPVPVPVPTEEYNVDDVDAMLAELELESEEIVEKKVNTPVLKEKKKVKNTETDAVKVADPIKVAIVKKSKKTKDVVVEK